MDQGRGVKGKGKNGERCGNKIDISKKQWRDAKALRDEVQFRISTKVVA